VCKVFFALGAVSLLAPCLSGCGNSNGLYSVRGKVLCKGEPAVGAVVYFHRKNVEGSLNEQISQGVVQQDGSFELSGATGKGAAAGDYAVLIEWKEGAGQTSGRSPAITAPDRFQGKYLDRQNPQFLAQVKPAKNQLPAFEIP
jgi:hypothetical protein